MLVLIHDLVSPSLLCARCSRGPINGVRLRRRVLVLLPDLDRLVRLGRDETRASLIKRARKDTRLRLERARLNACHFCVEVITRFPIHEAQRSVVVAGDSYVIVIDSHTVDDGTVRHRVHVLHERALGHFPLLDIVCRA